MNRITMFFSFPFSSLQLLIVNDYCKRQRAKKRAKKANNYVANDDDENRNIRNECLEFR